MLTPLPVEDLQHDRPLQLAHRPLATDALDLGLALVVAGEHVVEDSVLEILRGEVAGGTVFVTVDHVLGVDRDRV